MKSSLKASLLGAGAAVAVVGTVAVANSLTLPHTFAPNTPVRAADFNDNFTAVKAASDDNQAQITALKDGTYTKTDADGRFTRLTACYWKYKPCGMAGGTTCDVVCNAGDWVVSGGCDGNAGGPSLLFESFPGPSSGNYKNQSITVWPFGTPASDPNIPTIDQWHCRTSTGFIDSAYVFCCPPPR